MDHRGTKVLETERLLLRPFRTEDAEAMFRNWASDPEVTRFLTWPPHASPELTRSLTAQWAEAAGDRRVYQWAIVSKAQGEPIGSLSVVRIDEGTESMELGYCIGKRWWGQGLMTEAVRTVVAYLFAEVGALRWDRGHCRIFHPERRMDSGALIAPESVFYHTAQGSPPPLRADLCRKSGNRCLFSSPRSR